MPRHPIPSFVLLSLLGAASACKGNNTASYERAPGAKKSVQTKLLEAGANITQRNAPIDALSTYLDGFHFYNGDMDGQMEAHHYATILNEDVMQAIIFDGNTKDAKLMGVEYIISKRLFETLPDEEKQLWHSHDYEVKSGTLIAPGLPAVSEKALMKKFVSTYGKTWHTWHTDRNKQLPLGVPALMMGFTADGQLDPALIADRDRRFEVDAAEIAARRADIPAPEVSPLANAWQTGAIIQLGRVEGVGEHGRGEHPMQPPQAGSLKAEIHEAGKLGTQEPHQEPQ